MSLFKGFYDTTGYFTGETSSFVKEHHNILVPVITGRKVLPIVGNPRTSEFSLNLMLGTTRIMHKVLIALEKSCIHWKVLNRNEVFK